MKKLTILSFITLTTLLSCNTNNKPNTINLPKYKSYVIINNHMYDVIVNPNDTTNKPSVVHSPSCITCINN